MGKDFKGWINDYFSFLKNDRNGVLVLVILILITMAGHYIVSVVDVKPSQEQIEIIHEYEKWEKEKKNKASRVIFFKFNPNEVPENQLDSLSIPGYIKNNIIKYRSAGGRFNKASDLRKIYGMNDSIFMLLEPYLVFTESAGNKIDNRLKAPAVSFDPNIASSGELAQYGFTRTQILNIENFRRQGGVFRSPHDILNINGIDSAIFNSVKKHIIIKHIPIAEGEFRDQPKVYVELNSADSLDLIRLRGIGPVFASRILKYRKLLGGFYSADQMLEVYGFPKETFMALNGSFFVDTLKVVKLRLNFAEYPDLIRHPYLKKANVQAILKYRQDYGPFNSTEQLLVYGLMDTTSYYKIKPYFTCR